MTHHNTKQRIKMNKKKYKKQREIRKSVREKEMRKKIKIERIASFVLRFTF